MRVLRRIPTKREKYRLYSLYNPRSPAPPIWFVKNAEKPLKIAADIGKMKMGWTPLSNGGFIVP